jgi:hypothetical protein
LLLKPEHRARAAQRHPSSLFCMPVFMLLLHRGGACGAHGSCVSRHHQSYIFIFIIILMVYACFLPCYDYDVLVLVLVSFLLCTPIRGEPICFQNNKNLSSGATTTEVLVVAAQSLAWSKDSEAQPGSLAARFLCACSQACVELPPIPAPSSTSAHASAQKQVF